MKGTLSEAGFSELLQRIDSRRQSTVLELTPGRGGTAVQLYFAAGRLLKIEVTRRDKKDLLGEMLVRAGRITEDELRRALKTHKKTLRRLGDVLIEQGSVNSTVLQEFVDLQAREVLHSLFEWSEGTYAFQPGSSSEEVISPLSAEKILMEGFTLLDEWPVVRARINNYSVVYRAMRSAPTGDSQGAISANAVTVLALVDAHRDVNQIIDRTGLGEFETCKALSGLLTHGFIVPVEVRAAVNDPSGRQTRGWLGTLGLIFLNLIYLSVFALGTYWALILPPETGSASSATSIAQASGYAAAFSPFEQGVMKVRLERALEVYRFEVGRYPTDLTALLAGGYISAAYEPAIDLAPVEYVTIGHDFELR